MSIEHFKLAIAAVGMVSLILALYILPKVFHWDDDK